MTPEKAKDIFLSGGADSMIKDVLRVPERELERYRARAISAIDSFCELYGADRDISVFSVGGRSEISGNHTDHNGGCVLAAAINLDIIAVAATREDGVIRIKSEGHPEDVSLPGDEESPDPDKYFSSAALIAGMKHAYRARGYKTGGFDAYTTSDVMKGSGLSSSVAFEVMIGKIFSAFYNMNNVDTKEIAKSAQYAENVFFGKPCGLMDQMACATGSLIYIDFSSPDPEVKKIDADLASQGLALCIVNTGGSHVDLNDDYAAVPAEMKAVASLLSKEKLCELTLSDVERSAGKIREELGDRALMRAYHFFDECDRVVRQAKYLEEGDVDSFLSLVTESGRSSFCYLQNVYSASDIRHQGTSLALCLTERFLRGRRGAWRIQGGGFAGTIEAFVPTEIADDYKKMTEDVFGDGCCRVLSVRPVGAVKII